MVVGTAGHVDHGKSSLVRALTGSDPDRLPEEQRRGMTIELGFAFLPGDGRGVDLAFVDCPGHERFIHHMVAGAGSIDGALLIVSAAEGPSVQTREHLDILRLLGLRWGRVVLSKSDLVDQAGLASAAALVAELVHGTVFAADPPLAVSAQLGTGLAELKTWLFARAAERSSREVGRFARLPVDRVFSVQGHGTVVTGTLLSGELRVGDELAVIPGGQVRIRGLQVAHRPVDQVAAGCRTAVNLTGLEREQITRGAWLATPGSLAQTSTCDVRLEVLAIGAVHRQRVQVHHGTTSAFGRLLLLQSDLAGPGTHDAQIRLETPLAVQPGERLIVRRPSPSATVGGGVVVDVAGTRHARFSEAARLRFSGAQGGEAERLLAWLGTRGFSPPLRPDLEAWAGGPGPAEAMLRAAAAQVRQRQSGQSTWIWSEAVWERAGEHLTQALTGLAKQEPEHPWRQSAELQRGPWGGVDSPVLLDRLLALAAAGRIARWDNRWCVPEAVPPAPCVLVPAAQALLAAYAEAGLQPPYDHPLRDAQPDPVRAARALALLRERGHLIQLDDRQHLHRDAAQRLVDDVVAALAEGTAIDVQWLKGSANLTRKHAIPLLEWLDRSGVTRRVGERRVAGGQRTLAVPLLRLV